VKALTVKTVALITNKSLLNDRDQQVVVHRAIGGEFCYIRWRSLLIKIYDKKY